MNISIRNKNKNQQNNKSGFVILFAVLASTLILAMAVSIFNVAYKEQVLSGTTKASAYADAAANVGLECALYNDIKKHLFPDPNFPSGVPNDIGVIVPIPTPTPPINCIGSDDWDVDTNNYIFTFTIEANDGYGIFVDNVSPNATINVNRPGCVKVFVNKNEPGPAGEILTHIVSRGYNVACNKLQTLDDGTINPRIVERRSEVRYNSKGGVVIGGPILGCTDPTANNYNPSATVDNGSCIYTGPVLGCTDPAANNYNPLATSDDGSCTYGGSFKAEIKITAAGKNNNPPEAENLVILIAGNTDATIKWYPSHVNSCVIDAATNSANAIWPSGPTDNIGSFFNQIFPSGYPVGDFTDRVFGIKCISDSDTTTPGASKFAQVTVRYQPIGVTLPTANIWADPAVGANVGEFSSGGLLTITQADGPYVIRWASSDTTTCNETLEITSSGQILNGAHGFPQSALTGSSTIDPALIEPGDYTYRISCSGPGGTANDFVNVLVNDVAAVSSLDLKIKLNTESTYHDYAAGTNGSGSPVSIGSINAPNISSSVICASGTCEANKVIDLDWVGSNVSNCSATAKYKLSADPVSMWSTPTSVLDTAQQSITVTHYGVTKFTITCDKPDGSSITDTVFAYLTPTININSGGTGTQTTGEFHVPANIGSLMINRMTSPGGQGGLVTGNGVDGEDTYFNKDNGSPTGLDFLVTYGGNGGMQSQSIGGTALGGGGGTTYYPASLVSQGFFLFGHQEGVVGASTTTVTGGVGGKLSTGPTVYILSGGSSIVSLPGAMDGITGENAVASTTGGGGGGSGSAISARFLVTPFQVFKFKAGALTQGTPLGLGGTGINMQLGGDYGYNFSTNTYNNLR